MNDFATPQVAFPHVPDAPPGGAGDVIVQAEALTKQFTRGQTTVTALDRVDLQIRRGDFLALMGPSGSGKSTLLHLTAGMDQPTDGALRVLGEEPYKLSERDLARWRNHHLGFVFQSFNLIPVLTALENVELPLKLTRLSARRRRENAELALRLVGLGERLDHFPRQLSGGQEQRVAIARAIVTDPDLILADEPTGNLDAQSARDVLELLKRLNREFGKTILMVTHDPHSASAARKALHLDKGKFVDVAPPPSPPSSPSPPALPSHPLSPPSSLTSPSPSSPNQAAPGSPAVSPAARA